MSAGICSRRMRRTPLASSTQSAQEQPNRSSTFGYTLTCPSSQVMPISRSPRRSISSGCAPNHDLPGAERRRRLPRRKRFRKRRPESARAMSPTQVGAHSALHQRIPAGPPGGRRGRAAWPWTPSCMALERNADDAPGSAGGPMLETPPPPLRVLVLDGQDRQALAAVRSLGRRRNAVAVAAQTRHAPAFASRYCSERHQSPDPRAGRGGYVRWLIDNLQRGRFDALLCFDPATADIVSENRSTLAHYTGCALPPHQALLDLAAPQRLLRQAGSLGLGIACRAAGTWIASDQPSPSERFYLLTALMRDGDPVATFVHR